MHELISGLNFPGIDHAIVYVPKRVNLNDPVALKNSRFLVAAPDEQQRLMWQPWYEVAVLREIPWRENGESVEHLLALWILPNSPLAELFPRALAEKDIDAQLEIPDFSQAIERLQWWTLAPALHNWERNGDEELMELKPASLIEIAATEHRLGVKLPAALRHYHVTIGAVLTQEEILPLVEIQPLLDAYPGIVEFASQSELVECGKLIAFSAYLGNGNYWCFHRDDGALWYFKHDGAEPLTLMSNDVGSYFDALSIEAIGYAYELLDGRDRTEEVEEILADLFGSTAVRTWQYPSVWWAQGE